MSILSVTDLHYAYRKRQPILRGLELVVPNNSIYGFLGSNGAGKSTTIRNLLGLLTPASGTIRIFGEPFSRHQRQHYRRIGSLIETPSLYPNLTAREHLRLACDYQQVDRKRIAPILEQVGLAQHRSKLSKQYSTGMKQRLGLAIALLHDPELLLLDEPTNGLDPQGISDIRELLQALHAAGKTILLSSHLLSEIEKIATHVGVLKDGKLAFEGDREALEAWKARHQVLAVRTNDQARAVQVLSAHHTVSQQGALLHIPLSAEAQIPEIIRQLVNAELDVYEAQLLRNDLEGLFMELNKPNNV